MIALGQCLKHPESEAVFRCRQCNDSLCLRCRAKGEKDLCDNCGSYWEEMDRIEAEGGIEALEARRRRRKWGYGLISALVALDLVLAGVLLLYPEPEPPVGLEVVTAAGQLATAIHQSRGSDGRYPENAESVAERLPAEVKGLLQRRVLTYELSEDRSEYSIVIHSVPPGTP